MLTILFVGSFIELSANANQKLTVEQEYPNLETSCKSGDAKSCGILAQQAYVETNKHYLDYKKSRKYAIKACEGKDAVGCYYLGLLYLDTDKVSATKYFQKSCDIKAGPGGCFALASAYQNGDGVKKDISKAVKYYDKSIKSGNKAAYLGGNLNMGLIYYFGDEGIAQNKSKGIQYLKSSCDGGLQQGCRAYNDLK